MRIDPVRNTTNQVQGQPDKPKERVAKSTRVLVESTFSSNNQAAVPVNTPRFEISVRYNENQVLVTKFIDQKSGDVVQQIPPDQVLKIIESIQELLKESSQSRVLDTFR
jgi:uncharacterized FlaG/YvyC family protein